MKQKSRLDNFEFWEKQQQLEKFVEMRLIPLYGMLQVHLSVNLSGCPFVTKSFSHEDTVDSRELEPSITQTSC